MAAAQFEVWLADLNPCFGTEPGKVRPVVIVQTNLLNQVHPSTIICPITTNVQPKASLLRVHLKKGDAGLNEASDILVEQLRAIDDKRFLKKTGTLSKQQILQLKANLQVVLDLL